MFDPLSPYDLVHDELAQRRESGYDVEREQRVFATLGRDDEDALERLLAALDDVPRRPGWTYDEPESVGDILDSLPPARAAAPVLGADALADKILGGWLGRIAGCTLGKPVEDGEHWTSQRLREYLQLAGAWPLDDYIPVLDPLPERFRFRANWPHTTRGRIRGAARDDDIDYAILGLHMLERHGAGLEPGHVAEAWLTSLPYLQVYTAERAAYTNLLHRLPLDAVPRVRNPYREWIGALIRGDAFGWVHPGRPRDAVRLAIQDATLSHTANGVYGELWAAALVACAFPAASVREAFEASLEHIPPRSRLAEALRHVRALRDGGSTWDEALAAIQRSYGHYGWVHTINNAAVIAAGLLWGDGDYARTVGLTVQGGWDTDSNAATAGSVAGVVLGASALPARFVEPLEDRTRSALFGFDHSRISDLATRTLRLAVDGLPPGAPSTWGSPAGFSA